MPQIVKGVMEEGVSLSQSRAEVPVDLVPLSCVTLEQCSVGWGEVGGSLGGAEDSSTFEKSWL